MENQPIPLHRGVAPIPVRDLENIFTAASSPLRGNTGAEEARRPTIDIDEIERRLRDDRPDLYAQLAEQHRNEDALAELNADLRIIGYGLACGYVGAIIFRMSQLGWLS
jgi:hypothetical protein